MAANPIMPRRTWQDIAQELAKEKDSGKMTKLAEELNRALLLEEKFCRHPSEDISNAVSGRPTPAHHALNRFLRVGRERLHKICEALSLSYTVSPFCKGTVRTTSCILPFLIYPSR